MPDDEQNSKPSVHSPRVVSLDEAKNASVPSRSAAARSDAAKQKRVAALKARFAKALNLDKAKPKKATKNKRKNKKKR